MEKLETAKCPIIFNNLYKGINFMKLERVYQKFVGFAILYFYWPTPIFVLPVWNYKNTQTAL